MSRSPGREPEAVAAAWLDTAPCTRRSVLLPAGEAADLAERLHQRLDGSLPPPVSGFGGLRARAVRPGAAAVLVCGRRRDGGVRDAPAGQAEPL